MKKMECRLFMLMLAAMMSLSLGALDDESWGSENYLDIKGWQEYLDCPDDDEFANESSADSSEEEKKLIGRDTEEVNDNSNNNIRYVYDGVRGKTIRFRCVRSSPIVLTKKLSAKIEKNNELSSTSTSISSEDSEDSDYSNCQRTFRCNYVGCAKSFNGKSRLNSHLLGHTRKMHYECPTEGCTDRFKTYPDLRSHLKTHIIERPLLCVDCGMRFSTRGNLKSHMYVHSEERNYKCERCNMAFKSSNNLHGHFRSKRHQNNAKRNRK